ncbi:unnamed protein product [Durusdinium trenchii]|uniref:Uncharacterized protein n=2 Tax=Durusdinium trenchii TaxID=1381693 RepID=A0ABP0S3B3_9DINO
MGEAVEVTVGEAVEAYWPDDDQWLPAEISAILEDGNISITWEDGSLSDVPADYVRKLELEEVPEAEHVSPPAPAPAADDMDALLAAAEAAGATAMAEEFVGDSRPPSSLFWSDVLNKSTKETDEKKRLRPSGLMSSEEARRLAAKKAKAA